MHIYFCLYSFIGYLMESSYRTIIEKQWVSSGIIEGPFIPLYGFGAISLLIYDQMFEYNIFIAAIILTTIELISSYIIEKIFKVKYWDYSHHILNFDGRICLLYSFYWLVINDLFYFYIHPYILNLVETNSITNLLSFSAIIYMVLKAKKG